MGYRHEVDEVRLNRGTMACAARVNAVWELSAHSSTYFLLTWLKRFEAVGQFQGCSEFIPVSWPLFWEAYIILICTYGGIWLVTVLETVTQRCVQFDWKICSLSGSLGFLTNVCIGRLPCLGYPLGLLLFPPLRSLVSWGATLEPAVLSCMTSWPPTFLVRAPVLVLGNRVLLEFCHMCLLTGLSFVFIACKSNGIIYFFFH